MSPIITHEDELILAKSERELASQLKKLAKAQSDLIGSQVKYAENLTKANNVREMLKESIKENVAEVATEVVSDMVDNKK